MMREPCGVESCETSSFQMARNGQPQPRIARNRVAATSRRSGRPGACGSRWETDRSGTDPDSTWTDRFGTCSSPTALLGAAGAPHVGVLPLSRPSATTEYRPSRAIPEGASAPHVVYVCLICASAMYAYREFRHIGKSRGIKTRTYRHIVAPRSHVAAIIY